MLDEPIIPLVHYLNPNETQTNELTNKTINNELTNELTNEIQTNELANEIINTNELANEIINTNELANEIINTNELTNEIINETNNELTNEIINNELTNNINNTNELTNETQTNELTNLTNNINSSNIKKEDVDVFDFIKNPKKIELLIKTNELLNVNKNQHNKLLFVYSTPKVGSTSIVSSLRIFGITQINIIHIHDEEMLKVLGRISDITINELILYNKYLGKDVYVINVYRSPIERKISVFFEKIGSYHFNNQDDKVDNYNIIKVIERFNNIFPWIGIGDHFIDKYNVTIPEKFDYINKYTLVNNNGIKYITLRLKDSNEWGNILTNIFGFKICIIKDYESSNKPIKNLYNLFKSSYKIPINLLNEQINDKYFKYYYSEEEIQKYYNEWLNKSTLLRNSYTKEEFMLYDKITIENSYFEKIQQDHYFDEGCICRACCMKRVEVISKIFRGIEVKERIVHTEAKIELIQKKVIRANRLTDKINNIIKHLPPKNRGKNFNSEMHKIVSNNK
jgi:hypothetical protein